MNRVTSLILICVGLALALFCNTSVIALPIDDFRSADSMVLTNTTSTRDGSSTPAVSSVLSRTTTSRAVRLESSGDGNSTLLIPAFALDPSSTGSSSDVNPLDVNADGLVSIIDAGLITNFLNSREGQFATQPNKSLDANRDGNVSPLDVLLVINCINNPAQCPSHPTGKQFPGIAHEPAMILFRNGRGQLTKATVSYEFSSLNLLRGGADSFAIPFSFAGMLPRIGNHAIQLDVESDGGKRVSVCNAQFGNEGRISSSMNASIASIKFDSCFGTADLSKVDRLRITLNAGSGESLDYRLYGIATNGRTISSPEDVIASQEPSLPSYFQQSSCASPCGCDLSISDLGCGCGKPAPSGCDNKCGSTNVADACGVCGGDGMSCKVMADCDYYTLSKSKEMNQLGSFYDDMVRWESKRSNDSRWKLFDGAGAKLACLDRLVEEQIALCRKTQPIESCSSTKENGFWMNQVGWLGDGGDDVLMDMLFMDKSALDATRRIVHWASSYYACRADLKSNACDFFKSLAQPYNLRGRYIDKNCKVTNHVDSQKVCGDLSLDMILSPISIELGDLSTVIAKVVKFPLNPHDGPRWVHWRGSAKFPLLAIDINQNGQIDNGSELFGNWTFGGKHLAGLHSGLANGPWSNGFEPLSTLDRNRDGTLSAIELAEVKVWLDSNSNAVTDPGELMSAADFGLQKIHLQEPRSTSDSRDLTSLKAASIVRNGASIKKNLVDWYSPTFETAMEAASYPSSSDLHFGSRLPIVHPENETVESQAKPYAKTSSQDISGIWRWQIQGADAGDRDSFGYFWITQSGTAIFGFSLAEIPVLSKSKQDFGAYAQPGFLYGVQLEPLESPHFDFMVSTKNNTITSQAKLDLSSVSMNGVTTVDSSLGTTNARIQYSWTAKRVMSDH